MARLPRQNRRRALVDKDGTPTLGFQVDWQKVVEAIEQITEGAPAASAATTTHKVPVLIGGQQFFILLSNV